MAQYKPNRFQSVKITKPLQTKSGIMSVIEEVTTRGGGAGDENLLHQLGAACSGHPNFEVKGGRHHTDNNIPADSFRLDIHMPCLKVFNRKLLMFLIIFKAY